ncbi:MAG TPA: ComF family protein [Prosthecobacter sp.]|nr:ComF family protein [Prosthecobacter sp.]
MAYPGPRPASWLYSRCGVIMRSALDLLYPRRCHGCDSAVLPANAPRTGEAAWFCGPCLENLPRVEPPYCSVCGESFDGAMTEAFRCWNCEGRRIAFDFAVSAFKAEGAVRELIHKLKYNRQLARRGALTELLLGSLQDPRLAAEDLSKWLLVPVPLHFWRERRREFNQSWELCRSLSQRTGIPAAKVLRRTRSTQTQARLDREQRLANMRGVFALRLPLPWQKLPDLRGRRILLVDDVLTTGATSHACARALKQDGGAEKVVVITAARG